MTQPEVVYLNTLTRAYCSPDSQRGEEGVDLCGSDPGSCSLQPLVEVGRTLWIQPFFPSLLDHTLHTRDTRRYLLWRRRRASSVLLILSLLSVIIAQSNLKYFDIFLDFDVSLFSIIVHS